MQTWPTPSLGLPRDRYMVSAMHTVGAWWHARDSAIACQQFGSLVNSRRLLHWGTECMGLALSTETLASVQNWVEQSGMQAQNERTAGNEPSSLESTHSRLVRNQQWQSWRRRELRQQSWWWRWWWRQSGWRFRCRWLTHWWRSVCQCWLRPSSELQNCQDVPILLPQVQGHQWPTWKTLHDALGSDSSDTTSTSISRTNSASWATTATLGTTTRSWTCRAHRQVVVWAQVVIKHVPLDDENNSKERRGVLDGLIWLLMWVSCWLTMMMMMMSVSLTDLIVDASVLLKNKNNSWQNVFWSHNACLWVWSKCARMCQSDCSNQLVKIETCVDQ